MVSKKTYIRPLMKVINLEGSELLAGSGDSYNPQAMKLYGTEVDNRQKPESVSTEIWGSQW